MIDSNGVNSIVRLTELVAAHGVYALTVIAVFYLEWRARRNLHGAAPRDHVYFRKAYTSILGLLIVLMAVSTTVWIYATFFYSYKGYIRGSVMELTEQPVRPTAMQDPPKVIQQIVPQSFDIDLYQSKKIKDPDSTDGQYDLGWVLLPRNDVRTVGFRFQHHYETIGVRGRLEPSADLSADSTSPALEKKTISRKFTIDLQRIQYAPGNSIDLVYEPDPDDATRRIGRMLLRGAGTAIPIPWEETQAGVRPVLGTVGERWGARSWFPVAFAQTRSAAQKSAFTDNGEYDPQFARVLKARLASPDLATQVQARRVLVDGGSRSFPFIRDALSAPPGADHDASLLYQNLAEALMEIESGGAAAPPDIQLKFAAAFYEAGDYGSAAAFFDKVGSGPFDNDEVYFRRGFAYSQTAQYQKATKDYETYLTKVEARRPRAVTLTNLGIVAEDLQRREQAAAYYQKAIQADPSYPISMNNLAYLYAERGERLNEALVLANRALEKEPRNPLMKDTRGWILYKLGRHDEAIPVLKEAAALAPNETVIRKHLQIVEQAAQALPRAR